MKKNWNKTYNQNGFNLENARKMELNAEDLMILRWFIDFYPLMEKVCINSKEYGWVHYGYLLHNLQIIYCKEESVAKRFNRYCELGLIEKTVKNTTEGRKAFFRAIENITLLYTSHTDKNLDAHHDKNRYADTDKNLDAHHDKNRDNSSTIYSSTIYSKEKINKKDITTASGSSFNENLVSVKNGKIDIKANQHGQTDILCPCDQGRLEETLQEDKYFCCECSSIYSKNEVLNIIGLKNSVSANNAHTQTTYQGNLDNSTGKESLTVESVADKSYILNTQEKDCESWPKSAKKHHILTEQTAENGVNTNEIGWPKNSGYSVEFEEFWEQWGLMCKEKGSATGTKKEAYNEWQKAYKICGHQGIMRVLGVFIEYILIAYGSNKHAGRWFKIIEWKDIDTVINDYKTQAENIMKQKRPQQKPNQINLANIARNNVATVEMLTKIQEEKENFKPVSNLFCD